MPLNHHLSGQTFAPPVCSGISWTVASQAPLSMAFSRQENWSGLPFSSLRDLPVPGIKTASPTLAGVFFTTEPPGKPHYTCSRP